MSHVYAVDAADPIRHWTTRAVGGPDRWANCCGKPVDPNSGTDPSLVGVGERCRAAGCALGWSDHQAVKRGEVA